ncbi:MAG: WYL domain-containing protein [Proteobacteria bacterium]|nr:WYL domain-containing protein [Pseudomonadota bacterium]
MLSTLSSTAPRPFMVSQAEIPIESVTLAARQLLRLGAEVEVLTPTPLRAAITREAADVAALYA